MHFDAAFQFSRRTGEQLAIALGVGALNALLNVLWVPRREATGAEQVTLSTTLAIFIVMYFAVFGTGVSYMLKLVAKGPREAGEGGAPHGSGQARRPARPLSAAPDDIDPAIG